MQKVFNISIVLGFWFILCGFGGGLTSTESVFKKGDKGKLHSTLNSTQGTVGQFKIQWMRSQASGVLKVTHQNAPGMVLWESRNDQSFIEAGVAHLEATENRGSFKVYENLKFSCTNQTVNSLRFSNHQLIVQGKLEDLDHNDCGIAYTMTFKQVQNGHLGFEITMADHQFNVIALKHASHANEKFYGFGEQMTHMNLKGHEVPILSEEGGIGRGREWLIDLLDIFSPGSVGTAYTTYYSVPHYITSDFRSLFLENTEFSVFDLKDPNRVSIRLFSDKMTGRILFGTSYLHLIERFTEYTGRFSVPPQWLSQGAVIGMQGGTDRVRKVWQQLKDHDTPISGFWLQDWIGKRKTSIGWQLWWNWEVNDQGCDPSNTNLGCYVGWNDLVGDMNAEGIQALGYINTFLVDATEKGNVKRNLYQEAVRDGYLVKEHGEILQVKNTSFSAAMVDLTNPFARTWLKDIIKDQLLGAGLRGWMADFSEALPFEAELYSGVSGASYHNQYPVEFIKVIKEAVTEAGLQNEVVYFNRSGYTQSPGNASMLWEGDQMVTWDEHDGLISSIKGLLSGGFSGIALNHSDIGGYTSISQASVVRKQDLLLRWMETNAFTSMFRTHEGNEPDKNSQFYSNDTTFKHFAKFAKVYKALSFYRTQLFEEAAAKGYPVVRHPLLHFSDPVFEAMENDPDHIQFMLGSEFMVAPVVGTYYPKILGIPNYFNPQTVTERKVYLPKGKWVHIWNQKSYGDSSKGVWVNISAPLGQPPVFFKEGSAIGQQVLTNLRHLGVL